MADAGIDISGALEPTVWFLVFEERSRSWWVNALARGRFKHVQAVGWIGEIGCWIFYDVSLGKTTVAVLPDGERAHAILGLMREKATTVVMAPRPSRRTWMRFGMWCVPAIAHLVGIPSCALRPDAFYRDCLSHGGEILTYGLGIRT
jgi:hypothetical protein